MIDMNGMEDIFTMNIRRMERMMKGKSPEFYQNFGMTIGGLVIWNLSLLLGIFINVNKMHWLIYLLTNVCIMALGHHIGTETSIYFGKLNGWWEDEHGARKIYEAQYEHLKKMVYAIKRDSLSDDEGVKKEN
jgi:hypothetical protein